MRTLWRSGWTTLTVFLVTSWAAASAPMDKVQVKPKPAFAANLKPPADLAYCRDCARLNIRFFNTAGRSCFICEDLSEYLGLFVYFDPDLYIENLGTLASLPGTVKIEYYDLARKSPRSMTVAIPAIPAGGWDAVAVPAPDMVFLEADGIKMTIDYTDAHRAHHRTRTIRKCPDN